jgi:peptidoglycan/xylan/chitin deacetylase (PgdA/CDA1 family)
MSSLPAQTTGRGVLLAVAYHHVREKVDVRFPHLFLRTVEEFRRQLLVLKQRFEFPDPRDVRACLLGQGTIPERSCILTFDDGLRDHHDHVAPVLSELGIRGIFAVNTGPWENGKLLPVHMGHLLSAAFSYEHLAAEFEAGARRRGLLSGLADVPMDKAMVQYRYDTPEVARIKFFINAVIPQEWRAAVMGEVFATHLGADEALAARHYMTPVMVKALYDAGHTIALHSHWHTHLASESDSARRENLGKNVDALQRALGSSYAPRWISYPYGSPSSYNGTVIAECAALGCDVGLAMKRGMNAWPLERPMELQRVDTNEVEGGRNPVPWSELWPPGAPGG